MKTTVAAREFPSDTVLAAEQILRMPPLNQTHDREQFHDSRRPARFGGTIVKLTLSYEGDDMEAYEASTELVELAYGREGNLRSATTAEYFEDFRPAKEQIIDQTIDWLKGVFSPGFRKERKAYAIKKTSAFVSRIIHTQ